MNSSSTNDVSVTSRAPLFSSTKTSTTEYPLTEPHRKAGSERSSFTTHKQSHHGGKQSNSRWASSNASRTSFNAAAAAQREKGEEGDDAAAALGSVIQWDFAEKELGRLVAAWDAVSDAILHIILVIMFAFYFFPDVNSNDASAFRRSIRAPLLTSRSYAAVAEFKVASFFYDIRNAEQYTDYVTNAFLPTMYDITYPTGAALLVGAVRLRAQRVMANRCNLNHDVFYTDKNGALLATSTGPIAGNVIEQSCFGDLGNGGGDAKLVGAHMRPRDNELTTAVLDADNADRNVPNAAGVLWLKLSSNWVNLPVTAGPDAASGATASPPQQQQLSVDPRSSEHGLIDSDEEQSFNTFEADSSTEGSRWHYSTCEGLKGPARVTWGVAGLLGSYHCGGFYFDLPFWRPSSRSSSSSSGPSSGESQASPARSLPSMNDPQLVQLPYYTPYWERVSLQNATRYLRSRLQDSGSTFIDDTATRFVATEFYLYQPSLGLFGSVRLYAESVSGGAWVPRTSTRVFRVRTSDDRGWGAYSIVFFAFAVFVMLRSIFVGHRRRYHQASRKFLDALLLCSLWDALDAVAYVLLLISGCFRIAYLARCAQLDINLAKLTYAPRYPAELDSILLYDHAQVYLNAVVTVLFFGRVIRYFGFFFAPLVFISQVLVAARATLIGVALLLVLVLITFGMTGYVLLGTTVGEFATVDSSFRFFFYLLLRQVDVERVLGQSQRETEVVFLLWAFLLIAGMAVIVSTLGILSAALQAVGADAKISLRFLTAPHKRSERLRDGLIPSPVRWILVHHFLGSLLHPRRYPEVLRHMLRGRGRSALLHRAIRALRSYRRLRYPVRSTLQDVDSDVISEEQFMRAVLFHSELCGRPSGGAQGRMDSSTTFSSYGNPDSSERSTDFLLAAAGASDLNGTQDQAVGTGNPLCAEENDSDAPSFRTPSTGSWATQPAALLSNDASDPFIVFFYEDVWARLCEEWATSMTSKEAAEMQRRVVWATAAVERVVGARMDILQRLPGRLTALEGSVAQATNILNEIPVTLPGA